MNKKEFLAAEHMGLNFTYPKDYVEFLSHMEELSDTSWWLIGKSEGFFETCYTVVNEIFGSKKLLIPFAKWDEANVLACFDENHRVFFHVEQEDLSNVDWEKVNGFESFTAWLEWTYEDSSLDDNYESTRTINFKNEFLAAEEMDINFTYPKDYVDFLVHMEGLDETSWSLIGDKVGFFERCLSVVNGVMRTKKLLIPFAEWEDSGAFAYFDENHQVFIHFTHEDLSDGELENTKIFTDFTTWLEWVQNEDMFKR